MENVSKGLKQTEIYFTVQDVLCHGIFGCLTWKGVRSFFSSKRFVGRLIMLPELCDNFCDTKAQSRKVSIQD